MTTFISSFILIFAISTSFAQEIANGGVSVGSGANAPAEIPLREVVQKSCLKGAVGAWAETLQDLIVDPYEFMAHTSTEATSRYLEDCDQHVECKIRLYYEAHGFSASGPALEKLQKPMGFKALDVLQRNANSRMNSTYERNLRFQQTIENRKWVKGQPFQASVALDPKQENQSFWIDLAEKIKTMGINAATDDEVFCYYVAQILDPLAAVGLIAKSAKLAKYFSKGAKVVAEGADTAEKNRWVEYVNLKHYAHTDIVTDEGRIVRIDSRTIEAKTSEELQKEGVTSSKLSNRRIRIAVTEDEMKKINERIDAYARPSQGEVEKVARWVTHDGISCASSVCRLIGPIDNGAYLVPQGIRQFPSLTEAYLKSRAKLPTNSRIVGVYESGQADKLAYLRTVEFMAAASATATTGEVVYMTIDYVNSSGERSKMVFASKAN